MTFGEFRGLLMVQNAVAFLLTGATITMTEAYKSDGSGFGYGLCYLIFMLGTVFVGCIEENNDGAN
jgi:hypothetical protein